MRRDVLAVRTGGCLMIFMTLAADSCFFLYFVFLLMLVDIGWYWTSAEYRMSNSEKFEQSC